VKIFRSIYRVFSILILVVGLVVGLELVRNQASITGRASGIKANLVVDVSNPLPDTKNSWRYLAQGGEERGRSLAPVVGQVRNLAPSYIRIDHMYDFFPIVSKENGVTTYNWTEFDAYLRDILATGAKPFLSLSYNPVAFGVKDVDMPNLTEWRNLVKATIEHISGTNGLGISNVYYEVWNEPDLFGQFKVYPPKDYRDLYKASSDGALAAQNVLPFKIGGPATTSLYRNWFDGVTQIVGARVDFFSWHQYGIDTEDLAKQIENVQAWKAQAGEANLELFVTENGVDSANSPYYDNSFSAIHTLSSISIAADKIDGLFQFEIKDGPGPAKLWGRWGILTHEKYGAPEPKPRYRALEFLKPMALGQRVNIAGNGSWVTSFARIDEKSIRLFVVNYDPENKHVEAVPIRFTGIPYEQFTFTRRDFQGSQTQLPVTPVNKEWQTVQYFRANSAAILELTPVK